MSQAVTLLTTLSAVCIGVTNPWIWLEGMKSDHLTGDQQAATDMSTDFCTCMRSAGHNELPAAFHSTGHLLWLLILRHFVFFLDVSTSLTEIWNSRKWANIRRHAILYVSQLLTYRWTSCWYTDWHHSWSSVSPGHLLCEYLLPQEKGAEAQSCVHPCTDYRPCPQLVSAQRNCSLQASVHSLLISGKLTPYFRPINMH